MIETRYKLETVLEMVPSGCSVLRHLLEITWDRLPLWFQDRWGNSFEDDYYFEGDEIVIVYRGIL